MNKVEKKIITNNFNNILDEIFRLELDDIYVDYYQPSDLSVDDYDDRIVKEVHGFDANLKCLESDIETAIDELKDKLKVVGSLRAEYYIVRKLVKDCTTNILESEEV